MPTENVYAPPIGWLSAEMTRKLTRYVPFGLPALNGMISCTPLVRGCPVSARVPSGARTWTLPFTGVTSSVNVSTTWAGAWPMRLFWAGLALEAACAAAGVAGSAKKQMPAASIATSAARSRRLGGGVPRVRATEVLAGVTRQSCPSIRGRRDRGQPSRGGPAEQVVSPRPVHVRDRRRVQRRAVTGSRCMPS